MYCATVIQYGSLSLAIPSPVLTIFRCPWSLVPSLGSGLETQDSKFVYNCSHQVGWDRKKVRSRTQLGSLAKFV